MTGKFSAGRRWRVDSERRRAEGKEPFDFVILGPPEPYFGMPVTYRERYVRCRIEVDGHGLEHNHRWPCRGQTCTHGLEQDYPCTHLKKFAVLVEE